MIFSCSQPSVNLNKKTDRSFADTAFIQETAIPYFPGTNREENDVRSICADSESNIWAATAAGVFLKTAGQSQWKKFNLQGDEGPAYSVASDEEGTVYIGSWNGLYIFRKGVLTKADGPEPPVSEICANGKTVYALGPMGIWKSSGEKWIPQNINIARSVRDARMTDDGNLFIATDAGLYKFNDKETKLYQDTNFLVSCYAKSVETGTNGDIWAASMGGVTVLRRGKKIITLKAAEGIPSININCIRRSPSGVMWVGTDVGVVRYYGDMSHSLRFSRRWLPGDKVADISFGKNGDAWIATSEGISCITAKQMTLGEKERYFYEQLMKRHIREPWICGNLRLDIPGDTSTWHHADDDNDGEYTSGYLAMESFRFAATGDNDAREKAAKAFRFLVKLHEITGSNGLFARTIIPADWTSMSDLNRKYTPQEVADLLVSNPRYKPVEERWHLSADKKWKWKGDTSSDEMDGHMMGYFFYYEYAASEPEKEIIRRHVSSVMDRLIKNNYNLIDVDGKHTKWGVWSPDQLNREPDWASERSLNSFELLAYLKLAYHISGNSKYEDQYRYLIDKENYLANAAGIVDKNPAWEVYFDITMEAYLFPIFLKYEMDSTLHEFYSKLIDRWIAKQKGENLIANLTYEIATGKRVNTAQTIEFLRKAPLDLVDWTIDNTKREDLRIVHSPVLEDTEVSVLLPPDERATVRWDKNPWEAISGNPSTVREPVFWLWPYWMSRYLGIIKAPGNTE